MALPVPPLADILYCGCRILELPTPSADTVLHEGMIYPAAVGLCAWAGCGDAKHLTKHLVISDDVAMGLLKRMEEEGILGAVDMNGKRKAFPQPKEVGV